MSGAVGVPAPQIGARFQIVSVVPAAALVAFVTALALSGPPSDAPSLPRAIHAAARLDAVDVGLFLLAAVALALILHPLQVGLVKTLEGYRPATGPIARVHRWGKRRYEARYAYLKAVAAPPPADAKLDNAERAAAEARGREADTELSTLPQSDRLMPTSLGNVLRFAEDFAGDRYGLNAIAVIPRLFPLMPESMGGYIDDARNEMDLMANFVLIWLIATAVAVIALFEHGAWVLLALVPYTLAWLSYRACVVAAGAYGETLVWAIDLYRFELYEQLRLAPPADLRAELDEGERLCEFLEGQWAQDEAVEPGWNPTYRHPDQSEPE